MFYLVSVDFKFRCKHQCVHDTGNFIYLFVSPFFFIREHHNPSQSRLLNSLACSNDPCWWKKSNKQQWIIGFIGIFSIKGFTGVVPHQSLQPERCAIFELNLSFPLKKKSKQHFRYPFLIPWKCFMAENHWKSALLNLHFCRKEKYLPISRRSSGSRSGSKLKPPQKVFSPKKKMVRIVWTVQSPRYLTFPSFYVSPFERSADRTWFQFLVWPGQCNTSQPGKRHKKPGEYFAAWKKNLVVDTLSQWNDTTWLLILIS